MDSLHTVQMMRSFAPLGTFGFSLASVLVSVTAAAGVVEAGDATLFVGLACLGVSILLSFLWLPASIKADLAKIDTDTSEYKI